MRTPILPLALALVASVPCSASGAPGGDACRRQELAQLVQRVASGEKPEGKCQSTCTAGCAHTPPSKLLAKRLNDDPQAWPVVQPLVLESFRGACEKGRAELLDVLAYQPVERVGPVCERLLAEQPAGFASDHLMAFAARGLERFESAVEAYVREGLAACAEGAKTKACEASMKSRAVLDLADAESCPLLVPSAFLAFRGNAAGKQVLAHELRAPQVRDACRRLLAGAALEALGAAGAEREARASVHAAVLRALDQGDLGAARKLVLEAEFARKLIPARAAADLTWLSHRSAWHCENGAAELADAESVFARAERLAAL